MDLRIAIRQAGGVTTVELHGCLAQPAISEFERAIDPLGGGYRLDLTHLRSVDDTGAEKLARLRAEGIMLVGTAPYLALRIGARSDTPEPPPQATAGTSRADR